MTFRRTFRRNAVPYLAPRCEPALPVEAHSGTALTRDGVATSTSPFQNPDPLNEDIPFAGHPPETLNLETWHSRTPVPSFAGWSANPASR